MSKISPVRFGKAIRPLKISEIVQTVFMVIIVPKDAINENNIQKSSVPCPPDRYLNAVSPQ